MGSIFCWPRAVVFLLPVLLLPVLLLPVLPELGCFDLSLWAAAAGLDLRCFAAAGCEARWAFAFGDVRLFESGAAVLSRFFAAFVSAVLSPDALVCEKALSGKIHTHISARMQPAPNHLRIVAPCSKASPSKLRMRRAPKWFATKKKSPAETGIVNHPPFKEAMPVPAGLIQVTELCRP